MKQVNKSIITNSENDREPAWCTSCDSLDRCDDCDALDFMDWDCGRCDMGRECTFKG